MMLNILFTIVNIFGLCLILVNTTIITTILINYLHRHRKVILLLITNTYSSMLLFAVILLVSHVDILLVDLYGPSYSSFRHPILCKLQGTIMYAGLGICYMTFVAQAAFRCLRVVFYHQRSFRKFPVILTFIFLQWFVYILGYIPSVVWPKPVIAFYELDYYCGLPYYNLSGFFYIATIMFFLPIILVIIIYIRVLAYVRSQISQFSLIKERRRAQRDVKVTRRIIFIVTMMTLPGLPNIAFVIMTNINPALSGSYYMYRIQWMGPIYAILTLSIALVRITPQLRTLILSFLAKRQTRERGISWNTPEQEELV